MTIAEMEIQARADRDEIRRLKAKLAEANRNAEAERSAKWARLDKAEAEVENARAQALADRAFQSENAQLKAEVARLREALESIIKVQDDQTIWPAYSNEKGKRMGAAIENARTALRGGGE